MQASSPRLIQVEADQLGGLSANRVANIAGRLSRAYQLNMFFTASPHDQVKLSGDAVAFLPLPDLIHEEELFPRPALRTVIDPFAEETEGALVVAEEHAGGVEEHPARAPETQQTTEQMPMPIG